MRKRDFISKLNSLYIFDNICEKNLTSNKSADVKYSYVVWAHYYSMLGMRPNAEKNNIICIVPKHTNPSKWFKLKTIHHFLKMHHFDRMDIVEVHVFLSNIQENKKHPFDIEDTNFWIFYHDISKKEEEYTLSNFMQTLSLIANGQVS